MKSNQWEFEYIPFTDYEPNKTASDCKGFITIIGTNGTPTKTFRKKLGQTWQEYKKASFRGVPNHVITKAIEQGIIKLVVRKPPSFKQQSEGR